MTVENLVLPSPDPIISLPASAALLKTSEEISRLAATYEEAGVGIVEIDAEGRLLRVNKHIC